MVFQSSKSQPGVLRIFPEVLKWKSHKWGAYPVWWGWGTGKKPGWKGALAVLLSLLHLLHCSETGGFTDNFLDYQWDKLVNSNKVRKGTLFMASKQHSSELSCYVMTTTIKFQNHALHSYHRLLCCNWELERKLKLTGICIPGICAVKLKMKKCDHPFFKVKWNWFLISSSP